MKKYLIFSIGMIVGLILLPLINYCNDRVYVDRYVYTSEIERARVQTEIAGAYSKLLHTIWIDNPDYVENILWETDEFNKLDSLLEGDWEDMWFLWSDEDSIKYYKNISKDEIEESKHLEDKSLKYKHHVYCY